MYGYYDERSDRRVLAGKAALGLTAVAATAAAVFARRQIAEAARGFGRRLLENGEVARVVSSSSEAVFSRAERAQTFLRKHLENRKKFAAHFRDQGYVAREDYHDYRDLKHQIPIAEHYHESAETIRKPLGAMSWEDSKIDAFLKQGDAFQALLQETASSNDEVKKLLVGGGFERHLKDEAARTGENFDSLLDKAVEDLQAARGQIPGRRAATAEEGETVQAVRALYAKKLRDEAGKKSWAEKLTGVSRARISDEEAEVLRREVGEEIDYTNLRASGANARFVGAGDKVYDFSAFRSMFRTAKDILGDRIQIPLSPFQTGISLGQLFPFIGRLGERPLAGIYSHGYERGARMEAFFGDKLVAYDRATGKAEVSEESYNFLRPNKSHLKHMMDAQEAALGGDTGVRAFAKGLTQGFGDVEEGTTPYWDKIGAFFRKFTAEDYVPNILRRGAKADLQSEKDAIALSNVLRESGMRTDDEDFLSVVARAAQASTTVGGTKRKFLRDLTEDEEGLQERPKSMPEALSRIAGRLGGDAGVRGWAESTEDLVELSKKYRGLSPRVRKQVRDLDRLNYGDRERYLGQTASYADSRRAETMFGLDIGLGTHRITNLDILRSDLMADVMSEMVGADIEYAASRETVSFESLSNHLLREKRHAASFIAEAKNIDAHVSEGGDVSGSINAYLRGTNRQAVRDHLEAESRARFNILHTHPRTPREREDFTDRARVVAQRKDSYATWDGIKAAASRQWRAYTSPTSVRDKDATSGSMLTYFMADRLHTAFKEVGIGLSPASASTPVRLIAGMIFGRYVPIFLGIPEAHKLYNRVTRDVKVLNPLNLDTHRANLIDLASRMTHKGGLRRKLLALVPGLDFYTDDRSRKEEARAQRGAGYTAVRRGRWWAFGSREAFFGDHVSYYVPGAARFARSDWQAASNVKRNDAQYWRHFGGMLNPTNWPVIGNPYWWEESQKNLRPYLASGPAFDPDHPWNAPLNAVLGPLLKPRRIYHPEYLPKRFGGTLEDQDVDLRPTSPFYRRIAHDSEGDHRGDRAGRRRDRAAVHREPAGPGAVAESAGTPAASGSSHGRVGGAVGGQSGPVHTDRHALAPGYVMRIPRARKLRDASNDRLLERLNLFRAVRGKKKLTPEENVSPEEHGYVRSIGLDDGFGRSLYHLQEIAGLYGWFGGLLAPSVAHPVGKVEIANASRGYGRERRFYDQEIGGLGGNISDVLRRFLPHRRRSIEAYDPVPNNMPSWLPGASYMENFHVGDPFSKIPLGEARLPGDAYKRLHPGTAERMLRIRASSIGKSQAEMEAYLTQKEGEGDHFSGGSAAEMGTKMHRVLQERWRKLGLLEGDEIEVFDPKLNVSGHIDAILRVPDRRGRYQRTIVDIKTKTQEKFDAVKRTGKPEDENLDQILFYMHTTGIKRGLLTYVSRDNVNDVFQVQVKFDKKRFEQAVQRMTNAREAVMQRLREGSVSEGELYDPISKLEILGDVAPYSNEYKRMQEWASRNKGSLSKEDQGRLEDLSVRVHRQKQGFELHPYRFTRTPVKAERVQIAKFIGRDAFETTSGQTVRIAGVAREKEHQSGRPDEWWEAQAGLKVGSRVKVVSEDDSRPQDDHRTVKAAVYAGGVNVGRRLLRSGASQEDRDDYSAGARLTRFTAGERRFGRVMERLAHFDTPINTKFIPSRSGLEQYERTDVYGKRSGSWDNPVSSYIWPTLTSMTNKNPVSAALMGASFGTLFFFSKTLRVPAMQIGAVIGASLSFAGMAFRASGHPFIARGVRRRRHLDEYYDTLTYIKYRRLAAIETKKAKDEEGIDVDELDGTKAENVDKEQREYVEGLAETRRHVKERVEKLQRRIAKVSSRRPLEAKRLRRRVDALNEESDKISAESRDATESGRYGVGPHAQQALLYRQRYRATVRGALEGSSWDAALSALPKPTRSAIIDVIQHGSQRDKNKLFSILPKDQKAVVGFALNIDERKIPKQESLVQFFRHNALPDERWEGWRADASLDFLKARDVVRTKQDLSDFGIFPSTIDQAVSGSPEAKIELPGRRGRRDSDVGGLRTKIHSILEGHGITGVEVSVTEEDGARGSHEADVNMDISQRREHGFFEAYRSMSG